jgi:flagellum-specific peptidoglycan hydrolase FlgJ
MPNEEVPLTGDAFIDSISDAAIESQIESGVPASITIAQAAIESGRGKSGLTREAHNYFGIKGEGPAGHVIMKTREVIGGQSVMVDAKFCKYHNAAESFVEHGRFFLQNRRYRGAMLVADDAKQFAVEIQRAGYATDPEYAKKLIRMIDHYDLTRFDEFARQRKEEEVRVV